MRFFYSFPGSAWFAPMRVADLQRIGNVLRRALVIGSHYVSGGPAFCFAMLVALLKGKSPEPLRARKLALPNDLSLPKFILAALLVGGGVSLLSAGAARAVGVECSFAGNTFVCPQDDIILGDKKFSEFDWQILEGADIFGTVEFKWNQGPEPGYVDDFWSVDVDLNQGDNEDVVGPAKGIFSYLLEVTDPDWQFATVTHDSDWERGVTSTVKLVSGDFGEVKLTSLSGNSGGTKAISGQSITVTDEWTVVEGGALDSFTNTFTQTNKVPGPLPILGAGAAFGFSRKLRSRIKGSRLA